MPGILLKLTFFKVFESKTGPHKSGRYMKRADKNAESHNRRTGGFTLVEVLVALAVVGIGFFGIYNLHIQTIAASESVRFYLKAPMLARMKIAEIDSSEGEITEDSGDFGEEFAEFSWALVPEDVESETLGEVSNKLACYGLTVSGGGGSYGIKVFRFRVSDE